MTRCGKTVRDEHDLILLPMQLWSSLEGNKGGETWCEAYGCLIMGTLLHQDASSQAM